MARQLTQMRERFDQPYGAFAVRPPEGQIQGLVDALIGKWLEHKVGCSPVEGRNGVPFVRAYKNDRASIQISIQTV